LSDYSLFLFHGNYCYSISIAEYWYVICLAFFGECDCLTNSGFFYMHKEAIPASTFETAYSSVADFVEYLDVFICSFPFFMMFPGSASISSSFVYHSIPPMVYTIEICYTGLTSLSRIIIKVVSNYLA
jgi:hypothetical protein